MRMGTIINFVGCFSVLIFWEYICSIASCVPNIKVVVLSSCTWRVLFASRKQIDVHGKHLESPVDQYCQNNLQSSLKRVLHRENWKPNVRKEFKYNSFISEHTWVGQKQQKDNTYRLGDQSCILKIVSISKTTCFLTWVSGLPILTVDRCLIQIPLLGIAVVVVVHDYTGVELDGGVTNVSGS